MNNNPLTSFQKYSIWIVIIIVLAIFLFRNIYSHQAILEASESDINPESVDILNGNKSSFLTGATDFWFEQSFWDGNNQIYATFTQTPYIDDAGEKVNCRDCGVVIGVVTYKQVDGQWEFISVQPKIADFFGQWGEAPDVKKAKMLRLAPDTVALLIKERATRQQGYGGVERMNLLAYSNDNWHYLGDVGTGDDNGEACKEEDKSWWQQCWSNKGKISIKAGKSSKYPDLLVTFTGTKAGKDRFHVAPANNQVTYVFNGKEYIEAERNASKQN